jgi:hypothetical protein
MCFQVACITAQIMMDWCTDRIKKFLVGHEFMPTLQYNFNKHTNSNMKTWSITMYPDPKNSCFEGFQLYALNL